MELRVGLNRFLVFRLFNHSELIHAPKNQVAPLTVVFRILNRVIARRILNDGGERRPLDKGELRGALSEVFAGGGFQPVAALGEINGVEINFENLIL